MSSTRCTGSRSVIGSSATIQPKASVSACGARRPPAFTGSQTRIVRSFCQAIGVPRRSRKCPTAAAIEAVTTASSLTSRPAAMRSVTSLGVTIQSTRRCGPIGWFRTVSEEGSGVSTPRTAAPMRSPTSRPSARTRSSARRAAERGAPRRRRAAAARSSPSVGIGLGYHGRVVSGTDSGSGVRSRSTRSKLHTPPVMHWCAFAMTAKRSPATPSTTQSSQSGFSRSSSCDAICPQSRFNWRSSPGFGRWVCRTWYWRLKFRSSTHTGRPSIGVSTMRCCAWGM